MFSIKRIFGFGSSPVWRARQVLPARQPLPLTGWTSLLCVERLPSSPKKAEKTHLHAVLKEAVEQKNAVLLVNPSEWHKAAITSLVQAADRDHLLKEVAPDESGLYDKVLPSLRAERCAVLLTCANFEPAGRALNERTLNTVLAELAFDNTVPGQGVPLTVVLCGLSAPMRDSLVLALASRSQECNIRFVAAVDNLQAANKARPLLLPKLSTVVDLVAPARSSPKFELMSANAQPVTALIQLSME